MDYNMTEDQEMFVKMVKDFGEKRLLPGITERDYNHEYDEGIVAEMLEMGLAGTYFPEEYGGAGADVLSYIMTVEELAKYDAGISITLSADVSLCANPIYEFGTEEQKAKFLKPLCEGTKLGAFALTEPNAGTDAAGQQTVAVKEGGSADPAANSKLKDVIAKAKANNVPNDNIERIIKKAAGEGNSNAYESITYEGYGPGGVAVMVETLTDNRNRTAADLRHYFDKNGGNLGAMGCVAFLFSQKGVIDISLEDKDADEAMMDALDAGAEDFDAGEEAAEITTDPENYSAVVKAMEEKGYEILSDDLAMVPMTTTRLTDPDQLKAMGKLLDALEDNDDVQNVWHSLENEEDLPE